uniref:Uncharacterized protein n=1 Tax=Polaromonas sp. H8N TaxID=1840297 RepID=A0A2S1FIE2_9BURK|nr:Clp protease N-terminal domain-containing protein [Polaromonas sp. H8N]AWD72270.1 hypothetical protein pH8NP1_p009 [Polaromonas sp. H8N]
MSKKTKHANRYAQLPEAFRDYLRARLPGYDQMGDHIQMALMSMILQAPTKYREHSHHEGWASFHFEYLDKKFGRGKFELINQRLGIFLSTPDWSKVEGRTKPYKLTDKLAGLRARFLSVINQPMTNLLTEDGDILRTAPKQAIEAKRTQKNGILVTRAGWHGKPVEAAVPVNQEMLKKLALVIEAKLYAKKHGLQLDLLHPDPDPEYLKHLLEEVQTIYHLSHNTVVPGRVIHRYAQTESGRLYAHNVNLQNAYRPVRQAALHGLYDYDIENCHYSILDQMAMKHGHECKAIKHYLTNRAPVRRSLSEKFGIKPKQVKQALLALIYGASFSDRPSHALPKILGSVHLAMAFYEHPLFKALGADIKAARSAILEGQTVYRGGVIKNLRGLSMRIKGHAERQLMAHLLQGVESMALEAAHELYSNQIVLLQHDGFTATSAHLDIKAIEDAIEVKTGYRLKVALDSQIMVTLDDAFTDHPAVSIPNRNLLQPNAHAGLAESLVT